MTSVETTTDGVVAIVTINRPSGLNTPMTGTEEPARRGVLA